MKFSWRQVLAALVALVATVSITIAVTDYGPDHPPDKPRSTVTITVGSARGPVQVTAPAAAVRQAAKSEIAGHVGARDETPEGMSNAQVERSIEKQDEAAQSDQLPLVSPLAAPQQRGCVSNFVVNFSSRRGVAPRWIVIHYTVSHNLAGWGDVNAIVALFNRPAFQASSSYVYDYEGNCAYIVRESDKPWTQAAANPWSISFEVVAFGNEGRFVTGQPLAKLGGIIRDIAVRWKIPLRHGGTSSSCTPTAAGVMQHADFGVCGGGHHDIQPYDLAPIIAAAQKAENPTCAKVHAYRVRRREHKPKTAGGTRTFQRRLGEVSALGLKCVDGKVRVR